MKEGWNLRMSLYESNRSALHKYASRKLGCREAAEDVVQEAFINFVPSKPGDASLPARSYLFRIVHNKIVDILRRKKLEADTLTQSATQENWVSPERGFTPEESYLFCEDVRRSMDMISELPENQRIALEMVRFGGHPVEAVSKHLGVSVPTVYRLVQSAVATITLQLKYGASGSTASPPGK